MKSISESICRRPLYVAVAVVSLLVAGAAHAEPRQSSNASSTRPGSHVSGHSGSAASTTSVVSRSGRSGAAARSRPSGRSSKTRVAGIAGRHAWRPSVGFGWYYPSYYYWGYPGYYLGLNLGYYGAYPGPYWWGGYYRVPATYGGGYGQVYMQPGALDLNVKPKRAEVYVNGEDVGHVGRYDGFPGYLWLEPGRYELIFLLDGYRTERHEFTVRPGLIQDVRFTLEKGPTQSVAELSQPPRLRPEPPRPRGPETWREQDRSDRSPWNAPARWGLLKLDVEPDEATVYLDGRPLGTAQDLERREAGIPVSPGDHVLEVVYPGTEGASKSFTMDPDGLVALTVHLQTADAAQ